MAKGQELNRIEMVTEYMKNKLEISCSVGALDNDVKVLVLTELIDKLFVEFNKQCMKSSGGIVEG